MTTTSRTDRDQAPAVAGQAVVPGALAWAGRGLIGLLLLLGVALRVAGTGGGSGVGVTQHAAGLVVGVLGYLLLVRWGVWSWLAAVCSAPALLDAHVLGAEARPGWGFLLFLVVSLAAVALAWRSWPWPVATAYAAAVALAAALARLLPDPLVPDADAGSYAGAPHLPSWLLVVAVVVALAAALGLGRAGRTPVRTAVLVLLLAPVLGLALAPPDGSWSEAPVALVWWPAAAGLGATALLRGRRGRGAARPQSDDVDAAALADFGRRYGRPALGPVVVVIAAHDEEGGIGDVLASVPRRVLGLATDVVVVDDGSTDATAEVVERSLAHLCRCAANRGQGAALRLGYRLAREHGASYVITTDADGQYDVADLPTVLLPLLEDRADFVTGSRLLGHQETHDRVRRAGVHVFAWLVTLLTGRRVTDTSFGLRAMRVEVTERVTLNQPQYQSSELLIGAVAHGFRVLEVPATMHVRAAGSTKKGRNLVYGSRYARVVLGTWWREGCPAPLGRPTTGRATVTVAGAPGRVDA